jgi:hypothetical protein
MRRTAIRTREIVTPGATDSPAGVDVPATDLTLTESPPDPLVPPLPHAARERTAAAAIVLAIVLIAAPGPTAPPAAAVPG